MNERIKELAKQSGAMFDHMTWVERDLAPVFERFAKLIVRECLSKIELEAEQYHSPVWAVELVNDIKDHFGVEE